MTTVLSIITLGFFLGMRHALDADHVVAVTTFVSRERSVARSSLIGLVWGLGHTAMIMLVGGCIILFGMVIPPRLGLSLEFGVAIMLIIIGFLNVDSFAHWFQENRDHHRAHTAEDVAAAPLARSLRFPRFARPFFVGCVHGMAGSAALALLALPLFHDCAWALVYLLIFGGGSIVGMMVITAAISWPCVRISGTSCLLQKRLANAAGLLSLALGLFLVYEIGFVQGLFHFHAA